MRTFAASNDTSSAEVIIRQTTLSISRKAYYIRSRRRQPHMSETASLFVSQPSEMEKEHKRRRDYLTLLEDIDKVVKDNVE